MTHLSLVDPLDRSLKAQRERRLQNQREFPSYFTECVMCEGEGECSLCLSTGLITKGTANFMVYGTDKGEM